MGQDGQVDHAEVMEQIRRPARARQDGRRRCGPTAVAVARLVPYRTARTGDHKSLSAAASSWRATQLRLRV